MDLWWDLVLLLSMPSKDVSYKKGNFDYAHISVKADLEKIKVNQVLIFFSLTSENYIEIILKYICFLN